MLFLKIVAPFIKLTVQNIQAMNIVVKLSTVGISLFKVTEYCTTSRVFEDFYDLTNLSCIVFLTVPKTSTTSFNSYE